MTYSPYAERPAGILTLRKVSDLIRFTPSWVLILFQEQNQAEAQS